MNFKKFYIHFPIIILLCEWVVVLYLHYTNPYHFVTMSKETLGIVVTGLFFIILGYYFTNSFYLSNADTLPGDSHEIDINGEVLAKIILFMSLLSFIGLFLILKEIAIATNNFTLYFKNPLLAREMIVQLQDGELTKVSNFSYKLGIYLFSFMYPVATVGGVISLLKSRWKLIGVLPLILMVIYSVINLNRYSLITALGLWFFGRIYAGMYVNPERRKLTSRKTIISLILGVMFIVGFFYIILLIRSTTEIDIAYYALRSVYSYIAGPVAALEKVVFNGLKPLYGASSFRSIAEWLANFGLLRKDIVMGVHNSFVNITQGLPIHLNTYTFVRSPYEDFGIVGVGIIGFLWGMITRYSLERCFKAYSLLNVFFVSMMALSLFMTFYEFFFHGFVMFLYWFVIIWSIDHLMRSIKGVKQVANKANVL